MKNIPNDDEPDLPEIGRGETFIFACGPEVPCFTRCCAELALPVTPYDALRLRGHLRIASSDFIAEFLQMGFMSNCGLPIPFLKMLEQDGSRCPFVTEKGCNVYENRPGACRVYPLGRGAKFASGGIRESFYLVRESHCDGFDKGQSFTPALWLENQDLDIYNQYNDKFMRLGAMIAASGAPPGAKFSRLAMFALYQPAEFKNFVRDNGVWKSWQVKELQEKLFAPGGEEAALDFAFDWLELEIFGPASNVGK